MPTILERVTKVTAARLSAKEDAITPSASFTDDLGADSLDLVELIMGFEEEFSTAEKPVKIPDEDSVKIKTVQAAVDYIKSKGISDTDAAAPQVKTTAAKPATATPKTAPATSQAAAPPKKTVTAGKAAVSAAKTAKTARK